jgi:hypothetical protein
MRWRKLGLIYAPTGQLWWARSHAYLPTAHVMGDAIRVYFAGLDEQQYGRIGYVDLDARDPRHIKYATTEPVLDLGEPGCFDDSGVSPSCVLARPDGLSLYYIGWQRAARVPYLLLAGLANSPDGTTFERLRRTPVLERTSREPWVRSAITIIRQANQLRAWYVSATGWTTFEDRPVPTYILRSAESTDGIVWREQAAAAIDFATPDEFGFGRPWVIQDPGVLRMWYSIRSHSRPYRIGYAESNDRTAWVRKDDSVGIEASPSGWDSEMLCFPCVIDAGGQRLMFYNGNRHGRTGFGAAVLEQD